MILRVRKSSLSGTIAVPGSKSHTIRGVVAALQSSGKCILRAPLDSEDTRSALEAAKLFGADVAEFPDRWEIGGMNGKLSAPARVVNMNNSGTGLRMLTSLAAMQDFPVTFDGDDSLRTRLMTGLFGALEELGAKIQSSNGHCPFTVCGPLTGGKAKVDGKSSQFLTSLLFALPAAKADSTLVLDYLNEQPYAEISARWLTELGIKFSKQPDNLKWDIPGNQKFPAFDRVIPADFSTACFALAAGALCGGKVDILNLDFNDAQGDKKVFDFYAQMGCEIIREAGKCTVSGGKNLHGVTLDLNSTPDALPVISATAALIPGETRLLNVAQARNKETDRIAAMTEELRKMGADIDELSDGMIIRGGSLHAAKVDSRNDHRIAMALAIAGMCLDGETVIDHAEGIPVSYPGFVTDFKALGADFVLE
ncbi:MAG: 3-phosphoshikimate 1-carboxyvinyltransferase [Lentisphaerae bacterium]|nr:3-phosphoshikimate 1-carboxyvinyltransferase [Lentisphaerota bacterium]